MVQNKFCSKRTRQIKLEYHVARDAVNVGKINVTHVGTRDQHADMLIAHGHADEGAQVETFRETHGVSHERRLREVGTGRGWVVIFLVCVSSVRVIRRLRSDCFGYIR